MSTKKRVNRSDAEWATLMKAFSRSGLTQLAFCQQQGVNVYSFRHRYQHSAHFAGKRREAEKQKSFSELTVTSPAPARGLVVHLDERVRIECPPGTSLKAIALLARGLLHDA